MFPLEIQANEPLMRGKRSRTERLCLVTLLPVYRRSCLGLLQLACVFSSVLVDGCSCHGGVVGVTKRIELSALVVAVELLKVMQRGSLAQAVPLPHALLLGR